MYSQSQTAKTLSLLLLSIERKTGEKISLTKLSKCIGVSRKRFTEMLKYEKGHEYQEPSFTLISKIIDYFRLEGYALTYNDFATPAKKSPEKEIVTKLYNLDEELLKDEFLITSDSLSAGSTLFRSYLLGNKLPPLYDEKTIFTVDVNYDKNAPCTILCDINSQTMILRTQVVNNLVITTNIFGGAIIEVSKERDIIYGKIVHISL